MPLQYPNPRKRAYKGNNTVHISPFSELGIKSQQIYADWLVTKITYSSSSSSTSSIATEENQFQDLGKHQQSHFFFFFGFFIFCSEFCHTLK